MKPKLSRAHEISLCGPQSWDSWAILLKTFKTTELRCSPCQSWQGWEPKLKACWHPNDNVNGTFTHISVNLILWATTQQRVISTESYFLTFQIRKFKKMFWWGHTARVQDQTVLTSVLFYFDITSQRQVTMNYVALTVSEEINIQYPPCSNYGLDMSKMGPLDL